MAIIISRGGKDAKKIEQIGVKEEDYLQRYISDNPDILPLGDINSETKLLVIGREFDTDSGPIDVLAVDRRGDLYIIETKLFKNPDKRLVVAQMLDYGAALWKDYGNGDEFLAKIDEVIAESTAGGLNARLRALYTLTDEELAETRESIKQNLSDGNIKFVVLMDRLHERLRDLILFINQKSRFNIYAVEMEFYEHDGMEIVIPKLFGTEVKKDVGTGGAGRRRQEWNQESFEAEARAKSGEATVKVARQMIDWFTKDKAAAIEWGHGYNASLDASITVDGEQVYILELWASGDLLVLLKNIENDALRAEVRRRLTAIPGIVLTKAAKEPAIDGSLELLTNPETWRRFTDAFRLLSGGLPAK